MYELRGHYAKWNKPDIEEQILHDTTYTVNLKLSNSEKQPFHGGCQDLGEGRRRKILIKIGR